MTVAAPNAPTIKSKTYNSITLKENSGCEYKMDNGEWQDSNVFENLNHNATYTFYQRVKETDISYASEVSLGTAITTNKKSVSTPNAPILEKKTTNSVTLKKIVGCEYSKDGVKWQSSNVFSGLKAETEYTFYQRLAETETSYASANSRTLKVKTNPKEMLVKENNVWYYTENDKKVNATTLVKYGNTWIYVKNGKKCTDNTLVKYNGVWFHVKNGTLANDTTLVKYGNTWYYVKNGKMHTSNTLVKNNGVWYHVKTGKMANDPTHV